MKLTPLLLLAILPFAACQKQPAAFVTIEKGDSRYDFTDANGQILLGYQYAVYPAPEGQDPAFARSGFIHPLNTTAGQRLTNIQPDDHYHHYGVWNPWTHTSFQGREVDFWNLKKKEGTVRFAGLEHISESPTSSEIEVKHEHVVFNEDGTETIALNELQTIRLTATAKPNRYLLDIISEYTCGTDEPFTIVEYRYGGLCIRANENWNATNSEILTSEGIPRDGSDGSLARWVMVQGELDKADSGKDNAGLAFMSHPLNYNHPEPLRIWPSDGGHGQVFINFAPTKTTDWELKPGKTYTLRYRMLVFTGTIQPAEIENAWRTFSTTR